MTDGIVAQDPRYEEMFDIDREVEARTRTSIDDFYGAIAKLRTHGPVQRGNHASLLGDPGGDEFMSFFFRNARPHYTALSYEACSNALMDNQRFSSASYEEITVFPDLGRSILHMVGKEHQRHRSAVQSLFTPQHAQGWWRSAGIDRLVDTLISSFANDGKADLNEQLCARLPVLTVSQAFGFGADEALGFRYHLTRSISSLEPAEVRAESGHAAEQALLTLISARRERAEDDIVSALVRTEMIDADGVRVPFTDQEIVDLCRLIMTAGGGTTWRQLGITLLALLQHPDQLDAVRADRSLVGPAIEEAVRWNATAPTFYRLTTTDVDLEGISIPAGSYVHLCLGAANRDPMRWEDPDQFDIFRPTKRNLGFGGGAHTCLGRFVSTAEMVAAINGLLDRFPDLRLDPEGSHISVTGGLDARGVSRLPVLF